MNWNWVWGEALEVGECEACVTRMLSSVVCPACRLDCAFECMRGDTWASARATRSWMSGVRLLFRHGAGEGSASHPAEC